MLRAILSLIAFMLSSLAAFSGDNGSVITISGTARVPGNSGHGIVLRIQNIETHKVLVSNSLHVISNHSVIENVPTGDYIVTFIGTPCGDMFFSNESEKVRSFFGIIHIDPGTVYYLGTYKCEYEGKIKENQDVVFCFKDSNIPNKLIRFLRKNNYPTNNLVPFYPTGVSFVIARVSEHQIFAPLDALYP